MIDVPLRPVREPAALAGKVRRAAAALLDDAIAHARDPHGHGGPERAVHEIRKRIKELRALLRLVRSSLVGEAGRPARGAENDALRGIAGSLSGARDAAVMVETLDGLVARFGGELSAEAFAELRVRLTARHEREAACCAAALAGATEALEAARGRAEHWRLEPREVGAGAGLRHGAGGHDAWRLLAPDLERLYRRGRRAIRRALASDDAEAWHDWRRRAKDLRYALELLREAAPDILAGAAQSAKRLTDHLGEDHDLAVLLAEATKERAGGAELNDLATASASASAIDPEATSPSATSHDPAQSTRSATLAALAERRRAELRAAARLEGARLYAERAGDFVQRISAYWRISATAAPDQGQT